jgi:hypothetical protein
VAACAAIHSKQGLERPDMGWPAHWKSIARPRSCMDVPGIAVGGEQLPDGIW